MRWTVAVMTLGFFGLIAFIVKVLAENARLKMTLRQKEGKLK